MAEPARLFRLLLRRPSEEEIERRELLYAIKNTREQLSRARISFDNVSDPDLVDATIYEINSLQAHYSYLLRRAKEQGCEHYNMFKEYDYPDL